MEYSKSTIDYDFLLRKLDCSEIELRVAVMLFKGDIAAARRVLSNTLEPDKMN